jgi:hypothetical protein
MPISTRSPPLRSTDPLAREAGSTADSLRRCLVRPATPVTLSSTAARTPLTGRTLVTSATASAGPAMKTNSSATPSRENATSSAPVPARSWLHRARTIGPSVGMLARLSPSVTISAHVGARQMALRAKAALLTANATASGRSNYRHRLYRTRRSVR